jgi:putative transposase
MIIRKFHRRNLPHLYYNDGSYFVTYRLYGTIPLSVLKQFQPGLESKNKIINENQRRIFKKLDYYLDSSYEKNYLIRNDFIQIIKDTLHYPDGTDYTLVCYWIMPNHVHLVFNF